MKIGCRKHSEEHPEQHAEERPESGLGGCLVQGNSINQETQSREEEEWQSLRF